MQESIGNVTSLDGDFYVKAADGTLRELSEGDVINVGDKIVGSDGAAVTDSIIVTLDNGTEIITLGSDVQLFDASLYEEFFAENETVSEVDSVMDAIAGLDDSDEALDENIFDDALVDGEDADIDELETAANDGSDDSAGYNGGKFAEHNNAFTDINADDGHGDFEANNASKDSSADDQEEDFQLGDFDIYANKDDSEEWVNTDATNGLEGNDLDLEFNIALDAVNEIFSDGKIIENLTNVKSPTLSGKTSAESEILVTDEDGTIVGRGNTDTDGNFAIDVDTMLDGIHNLTVTAKTEDGNEVSTATDITIDTFVNNFTANKDIADDFVTYSGTSEVGSIVDLIDKNGQIIDSITVDATGSYSIQTDNTSDLEVQAKDIVGNIETITINNIPIISVLDTTVEEDTTTIIATASDIDGTVSLINSTSLHGTLSMDEDGNIIYTPDANYYGNDSIVLNIIDNNGGSITQSFELTVNDINDAPTLSVESTKSVDEDGSTTVTFSANDVDGTLTTTASAQNGTVVVNEDGTITYTPDADYNGSDTITVTTTDDDGAVVTQTSSITVNDINDAPEITLQSSATVDENGSVTINYTATDIESDVTLSATANNGEVTINDDGTLTFTPNENYNGSDTITLSATDADGAVTTQDVAVTINAVNDGPVASDDEGTSVLSLDGDGDYLSANLSTLNPENDGQTTVSFTMDWDGTSLQTTSGEQWATLFSFENYDISLAEVDGDVTFGFNTAKGDIFGIENADQILEGSHEITVVFDNTSQSNMANSGNKIFIDGQEVELSYERGNSSNVVSVGEDVRIGAFDYSNDSSVWDDASRFTGTIDDVKVFNVGLTPLEIENNTDNLVAHYNFEGETPLSDKSGNGNDAIAHGDAHVIGNSTTTLEDTALVITADSLLANDTDVDGDTLSITEVTATNDTHGIVSLDSDGNVVFTPEENYNGSASFEYTVSDGNGGTDTATVTLNVDAVNDSITQVTDTDTSTNSVTENLEAGASTGVTLNATDADGDAITYSIADDVPFTVDSDGVIVTSESLDYEATDSYTFDVTATSADGTTSTQNVTINIENVVALRVTGTAGDDIVSGSSEDDTIQTGAGNDVIDAGAGNDYVNSGAGDDILNVGDEIKDDVTVDMGSGNDTVTAGALGDDASIDMGSGDDTLEVDHLSGSFSGVVDGGEGYDTLSLKDVSKDDWDSNHDGIRDQFSGFEKVILSDGETVISESTDSTSGIYSYDVTLSATQTDTDGSESLSAITIDNVPSGVTISGVDINADGTYTIPVNSDGSASVTLTSASLISNSALNEITASITTTESSSNDTNTVTVHTDLDESVVSVEGETITMSDSDGEVATGTENDDTITMGDGKSVKEQEAYGGDGDDTINIDGKDFQAYGEAGDDTFVVGANDFKSANSSSSDSSSQLGEDFEGSKALIDGGEGLDTLMINEDITIDFGALDDNIRNIEVLDLESGAQSITSLSTEDVLNVTDDDNILRIDGDDSDSINLNTQGDDAEWTLGAFKTDAETGATYQEVTGIEDDKTVTLEISTEINISES
ncbi:tandem-95 repeat protein [Sulfurimonas sp. SAG-AH-194-I05]|nr:tandem-95 repeat protein [Sulfurimonas sp. SAG-AH-194-I05]MDF1874822.1 tandem-95 repeat protein [Sulfurimonas sp. SAG-AH-194-I05]